MTDLFNNREIATGIWLVVAVVWFGKITGVREAFAKMLKIFLEPKIFLPTLLMAGYLALEVLLLRRFHLWDPSLLKDAIYWFLLTGFVLFMNIMGDKTPSTFFKKAVVQCVAVTVFLEFLLNLYTFPLWGELIFIPTVAFLGAASAITETDSNLDPAKKLFEGIQTILGIIMVIYLVRMTWLHHSELSLPNMLLSVLLPISLTILFIPFLYLSKLIADYEMFFVRLRFVISKDDQLRAYTRLQTFFLCTVSLSRLGRFEKTLLANIWDTNDRDGINRIIQQFKSGKINET